MMAQKNSGALGPVGQQAAPPQTFGTSPEEAQAFITDIDKAIFGEQQQAQIVSLLHEGAGNIGNTIGQLAGSVVVSIGQRRAQEQGVRPHIKLAINGAARAIKDLSELAQQAKIAQVSDADLQQAQNMAGEIIQGSLGGGNEQRTR